MWTWAISISAIFCVLLRPWKLPEWVWAVSGAALLIATGSLPFHSALTAVAKGTDVYLFLVGMMLLSEQAREAGLFDWLATWATRHAHGSSRRLFALIYGAGTLVTIFMSNDATAVVLTPAVYAAVKKAGAKPTPYLFACAMIANAASFVLPISNPANLVVFGGHMPKVFEWLKVFLTPSLASIAATFAVLYIFFCAQLHAKLKTSKRRPEALSARAQIVFAGIGLTVGALLAASALGQDLGLPTLLAALTTVAATSVKFRKNPKAIFGHVAWGVIPLVAGLFVLVEAVERAGALEASQAFLRSCSDLPAIFGKFASAFGVGTASNVVNNLPAGLLSGAAVRSAGASESIRNAVLVGVDLGPNLSITGSLATILWLMALRREGESVSAWEFLKIGALAMPLSLSLALLLS